MDRHKLRIFVAKAAAVGAAGVSATLMFGSVAGETIGPDPYGGSDTVTNGSPPPSSPGPQAPHFYNGNVEQIRGSGSDTTFFLMQKIGDLYTTAALYGCTLNSSAGQNLFNTTGESSTTSNEEFYCAVGGGTAPGYGTANISTTDTIDNWDRTEVTEGVDDVGSGAGQGQLCGSTDTPLPVDFARSSKPAGTSCGTAGNVMVGTGYAKDGVPAIDWTKVNPTTYGTSSTYPYSLINGGVVGPVAAGWLPGDPNAGPYSGFQLATIANNDNGADTQSTAYRMWCAANTATGASEEITDWGSLSNLGGPSTGSPAVAHPLEIQVAFTGGQPTATFVRLDTGFGSTTNLSTTVLDPQAVAGDLNDPISGDNIPANSTITAVTAGTGYTISNAATGTDNRVNFAITGGESSRRRS